jgi:hypothetical protein
VLVSNHFWLTLFLAISPTIDLKYYRITSMRANTEDNGSVEEVVNELCNVARNEYEIVLNLSKSIHKVKEVFALALYKVTSLPSAPVASRVEDMPSDFRTNYLDAVDEANVAVNALRKITKDVLETFFNVSASTETSEDAERVCTSKPINYDKDTERSGQGSTVGEIVKCKLKVVCDSYDKARLMLIREMQKNEKLMETIMADAPCNEDEVLFNVRGELVAASRVSLINTTTANRTYFDGLLSSGGWKSDIIGMCTIALEYDLITMSVYRSIRHR